MQALYYLCHIKEIPNALCARSPAKTRERVVHEAAREIREKGPDGVAVAGVMARAGLTHGGFYSHFASKDELVGAAVSAMFEEVNGAPAETGSTGDAAAKLRGILPYYFSPEHRDDMQGGCPMVALCGDMARTEGVARSRFQLGLAEMNGRLATALAAMGVDHPESEANVLQAQMVGALTLARAMGPGEASDAMLRDGLRQALARYGLTAQ